MHAGNVEANNVRKFANPRISLVSSPTKSFEVKSSPTTNVPASSQVTPNQGVQTGSGPVQLVLSAQLVVPFVEK
jgi:hypothetical protein